MAVSSDWSEGSAPQPPGPPSGSRAPSALPPPIAPPPVPVAPPPVPIAPPPVPIAPPPVPIAPPPVPIAPPPVPIAPPPVPIAPPPVPVPPPLPIAPPPVATAPPPPAPPPALAQTQSAQPFPSLWQACPPAHDPAPTHACVAPGVQTFDEPHAVKTTATHVAATARA